MYDYRDKTALITGASSGIGEALAHALAARGMHVILVARSRERLQTLAETLADQYGIRTYVLVGDLSLPETCTHLWQGVQDLGLTVDLLVNNAGLGAIGPFETISPAHSHQQVMVNVAAVVDLTHTFLPAMVERGEGAILNVASMAGFLPSGYTAVYSATKAFVLAFSAGLWAEYRQRGIRVLALCPGVVRTNFFVAAGAAKPVGADITIRPVQRVVREALKALEHNRVYVIPGRLNYVLANLGKRIFPLPLATRVVSRRVH